MPGSPTIFAASIPNITALRNDLDYGDARLPRCATFNDDTRAFRRKFKTSRGVDGVDLYDWRSQVSQAGLNEMTTAYLDKEGNGELFWPDDKSSKNYNQYQYSKDRDRIRRLVKQLFFRLNQQQFRNQKYKNKDNSDAREDNDNRGRNRQTAIDVESTINHDSPRSNEESATVESATADLPNFDQMYDGLPVLDVDEDVCEVPESNPTSPPMHPRRMRQFESINQRSRTKRSLPTAPDPGHPNQQSWKRQKKPPKAGLTRPITTSNAPNPQKRESPRTNKARGVQKEGYMMGTDALDKITKAVSPERGPSLQRQGVSSRPRQSPTPETPTISFRSPRASKPMQRLGYATGLDALDNTTEVVSLERQHSPQQPDGPSRLRRSLTPEAPMMTFRGTADHMRESPPSDSGQSLPSLSELTSRLRAEREPDSPSTPRQLPSHDIILRERNVPEPDEANFAVSRHPPAARPTVEKRVEPRQGNLVSLRQEKLANLRREHGSEQLNLSFSHSSISSALVTISAPNGRPSTGGSIKPSINFIYRIVLSRTPKTITVRWNPQGRFQDKTLAELLRELPFHDRESQGLIFTIESDCMRTVERITNDDEDSFVSMKRYIAREHRGWFHRQTRHSDGTPPRLVVDIVIEQMGDDSKQGADRMEDLELELEW